MGNAISEPLESRTLLAVPTLDSKGLLTVNGTTNPDKITLTISGANIKVDLNGVVKNFVTTSVKKIMAKGDSGDDAIRLSSTINVPVTITGDNGNDSILGGGGNELIQGGKDNDLLVGDGADTIRGDAGSDTITGGPGGDSMDGNDGDDFFITNDGVKDTVNGGSGNDSATEDSTDTRSSIEILFATSGSSGSNSLTAHAAAAPASPTVSQSGGTLVVQDRDSADTIVVSKSLTAGKFDVTVQDSNGATLLNHTYPQGNNPSITLVSVLGNAGGDTIYLRKGDMSRPIDVPGIVDAGAGGDTVYGGDKGDRIEGSGGNDSLRGENGDDYLNGGNLSMATGDGGDTVKGGLGNDTVIYIARTDRITVNLNSSDNGVKDEGYPGAPLFPGTPEGDDIQDDVENILSGRGNDTLKGDSSANFISGGRGDDQITAFGGNDKLVGDAGMDTLNASGPGEFYAMRDNTADKFDGLLDTSGRPNGCFVDGDANSDESTSAGSNHRKLQAFT